MPAKWQGRLPSHLEFVQEYRALPDKTEQFVFDFGATLHFNPYTKRLSWGGLNVPRDPPLEGTPRTAFKFLIEQLRQT